MESVKSIVKDVVYGKSKIHTNMEFTFSNNKNIKKYNFYLKISCHSVILLWQSRFLNSSMVERTAVNRDVVGSSPTWGAYIKFLIG